MAAETPISSGFSLLRPSEGINYNFVAGTYAAAVVLFVALLLLDKAAKVPQVEGFWIIFSPFVPCLAWALLVRSRWLKEEQQRKSKTE